MVRRIKSGFLIVLVLLFLGQLTACSQSGEKAEADNPGYQSKVVRISILKSYSSVIPQIIMLKNYLNDELPKDVTVEWNVIESGATARDSIIAGKLDIATMGSSSFISAFENGLPIVPVANSAVTSAYLYSNNPQIKSLDDIKPTDKISTTSMGNSTTIAFNMIAKEKYGDPKKFDSNYVVMAYNDVFSSVVSSKDLAAAIVSFPTTMKADSIQSLTSIFDLTPTLRDNNIGSATYANQKFYEENPAIISAFCNSAEKAEKYVNENVSEAAQLLSEYYENVDAASVEKQIQQSPPKISFSESAYDKVAGTMYEAGILSNSPKKFSELPNYSDMKEKGLIQ